MPLPDVSSDMTFFTLKTDVPLRPFVFQDRMPVEMTTIGPGSETEFLRGKHLYGCRGRYRLTFGHWFYAVRSVFA